MADKANKRYANPKTAKKGGSEPKGGQASASPKADTAGGATNSKATSEAKDGKSEGQTEGASPAPEKGIEDASENMNKRHFTERSDLMARHDKERTQMHGRHEADHKAMAKRHLDEAKGGGFLGGISTGEAAGPSGNPGGL